MSATGDRLVEPLRPYIHKIVGAADRQSVGFVSSTWHTWLEQAAISDTVTKKVFGSIGVDAATRPQLRAMNQDAYSPDGRLALLIAVLIWGRGKSNGRMRDHIVKVLTDPRRESVLEETAGLSRAGKIAEAYQAWTLPGLQAPFFTKWLWATSSGSTDHCCLVLDARVWKSLGAFGWDSRVASGRRDWPSRYAAYVEDAHACADRLGNGISAEDVEFVLYWVNGETAKLKAL